MDLRFLKPPDPGHLGPLEVLDQSCAFWVVLCPPVLGAALWGRCGPWWDCLRACSQLSPVVIFQVGLCLSRVHLSAVQLPSHSCAVPPRLWLQEARPTTNWSLASHHLSAPGFLAKAPELTGTPQPSLAA